MRKLILILALLAAALGLAACNGDEDLPPIEHVLVVTATPEPGTILLVITTTPDPNATAPVEDAAATEPPTATAALSATPLASATPLSTATPLQLSGTDTQALTTGALVTPTTGPNVTPTSLPQLFPTTVHAELNVAEQVFEGGRMFWIRNNQQIWVMVATGDDPNSGDWYCYHDPFIEGEMELDPSLLPPDGLYQPRRGFGKLWRNHPELREALGWAKTPEFELTSNYTYIAGGSVQDGEYFPGPGEHRLTTLYDDTIAFFEGEVRGECQGGTWRMTPAQ